MFDMLFPNWSNPTALAVLVGMRILFNVYLTVMVSKAVGLRKLYTIVMGVLTLFSAILTILLLRQSWLGLNGSYVEFIIQAMLIVIAGYVAYSHPSGIRRIVTAISLIGATVLLVVMVPIYGEAFVAP